MKKMNIRSLIAGLLVLTLMLSCLVGCGEDNTATEAAASAQDAIDYLKTIYKDEGAQTAVDYQRFSTVRIAGVPFEVQWSASIGEDLVKIVANDDGTVTVDVNEECEAETKYVLTASVTNAKGESVTHSWNYVLPAGSTVSAIVEEAFALQPGEDMGYDVTLTGKVVSIYTAYDPSYKNVSVVISVAGKELLCYRMKGTDAEKVVAGDTITVTGRIKNYNGTIEFDSGCEMSNRVDGGTVVLTDPKEIVEAAFALGAGEAMGYAVTLTGKIVTIDTPYDSGYNNITVSIEIEGFEGKPIKCYRLKGEGAENLAVGDVITVTGIIKNYQHSSGDCEVEFDSGCTFVK